MRIPRIEGGLNDHLDNYSIYQLARSQNIEPLTDVDNSVDIGFDMFSRDEDL